MSKRFDRANSQIQKCISEIIHNKMNDPRIDPLIYVSEVNLTPDFQFCKIKIALDSPDKVKLETIVDVLNRSQGFIKRELANMVDMPFMPKLKFEIDKGTSASIRINEILKTLNKKEEE